MTSHLDNETIGLLHSAGFKSGANVHVNKHYGGDEEDFTFYNARPPIEKYSIAYFKQLYQEHVTKQNVLIFTAVVSLVLATAMERITFKIMVDRMLPYKFVLVQIIFLLSAIAFVVLTKVQRYMNPEMHEDMTEFPQTTIFLMAVADTIPFLIMAFSASGVPPTMTVILMHSSTIFVVLGSRFVFPYRNYTNNNYMGIGLIAGAIGLCFLKITFWRMDLVSSTTDTVGLCCWAFLTATSLHGLATLYKEKGIIEWSRPIDNMYLTSCLFFYQFLVTLCFALIFNLFRAIFGYGEFVDMISSIYNGWQCFFGVDLHLQFDEYVDCSDSMGVVLGYVLSNAVVVVCMSTVLQLSHQILGRATEAAILCAFGVLWLYDVHINDSSMFGGNEGLLDIFAIIILIAGMEVYDRDPEPDVQVITNRESPQTAQGSSQDDKSSTQGTPM